MAQLGRVEFGPWEDVILLFTPPYYGTIVPLGANFTGASSATWAPVLPAAIGDLSIGAVRPDGSGFVVVPTALMLPTKLLRIVIPKASFVAGLWFVTVDWAGAPVATIPAPLSFYWGVQTPATAQQFGPTVFSAATGKLTTYDKLPSAGGVALFNQLCYSDTGLTILATSRASVVGYGPQVAGA